MQNKNGTIVMESVAAPAVPDHWQPQTIAAEEVENSDRFRTEPYTWYVREVGPWRLECFPPEPVLGDAWEGYAEFNETHEMRVEADSLAEAVRLIEQMMATLLTSCLIGLVGGGLPDAAWETAIFLAEG